MKKRKILADQRVVRYVRPRLVHSTGRIDPEAFVLRVFEDKICEIGLSINWLDVFSGDTQNQLQHVTTHIHFKVTSNGRFAEFTVEDLKMLLAEEGVEAAVCHDPLDADEKYLCDPSHAELYGLPSPLTDRATEVGAVLARAATLHSPPN